MLVTFNHMIDEHQRKKKTVSDIEINVFAYLSFQGLKFEVIPSTFEETLDKCQFPNSAGYVVETARHKALEVFERLKNDPVRYNYYLHSCPWRNFVMAAVDFVVASIDLKM